MRTGATWTWLAAPLYCKVSSPLCTHIQLSYLWPHVTNIANCHTALPFKHLLTPSHNVRSVRTERELHITQLLVTISTISDGVSTLSVPFKNTIFMFPLLSQFTPIYHPFPLSYNDLCLGLDCYVCVTSITLAPVNLLALARQTLHTPDGRPGNTQMLFEYFFALEPFTYQIKSVNIFVKRLRYFKNLHRGND